MWPCERLESIDSTQRELQRRLGTLDGPTAVWTTRQTAGIGSHGRSWKDSLDGFAWSVAWPTGQSAPEQAAWPARLSLMALQVLERALPETRGRIGLKWPNDLMAKSQGKLGGVLVSRHRAGEQNWLVAGIGLNLSWPVQAGLDRPVADLKSLGVVAKPESLAKSLCAAIASLLAQPKSDDWASEFSQRDLFFGREVVVMHPHSGEILRTGLHQGVDCQGRLQLLSGGSVVPVQIGELSLRMREELI